ncbi:iron ABC transporter ATP-binding protein [Deinococcus piscis]|uniref:Iron ABC transporter ATP-binding protein n=1 Tax=Deinococcus piscis TaxID=394230 RepID=A0ABQ3K6P0_9DEIO|nr:ABC transporter ATP-binding protein [Deinococcus piscis]GHG03237.1 iron ABC transporter ATP-binding protein [Deinococcus piscis]
MTQMPLLSLRDLTKSYGPGLPPVVQHLNLDVGEGELVTLLGPSGCGKTTTLRLIAGLEAPDGGQVALRGQDITPLPPERRGMGLVFQDYALFPHLSVLDNVLFGLRALPAAERRQRAQDTLALVGLTVFEGRMPHQLSGGQQQRVALARALAVRPALLLLDEPFSNLDASLRHSTRAEVRAILRQSGTAALLVTHDQEEALAFSDRVVVMRAGAVEQAGPPAEVYAAPRTAFVANFLGRANLLTAAAQGDTAECALGRVPLSRPLQGTAMLCLRPEQLRLNADPAGPAEVLSREFRGPSVAYTLRLGEGGSAQDLLVLRPAGEPLWAEGTRVAAEVMGSAHVLD